MSLRAAQILLPVASADALREALGRALERQKPPPRPRQIVALLAEGWAALHEAGRQGADGGLARLLSELLSTEALALELDGATLSLKLRRFTLGEPVLTPEVAFPSDVELDAWRALRERGVPAALRLLEPEGVQLLAEGEAESGFPALLATVGPQGVSIREARALPPSRREAEAPEAAPDLWVESALGEQCALEVRTLTAEATPELAAALAAIEEAQALRLAGQLAVSDQAERLPRIAFAWRGESQAALAKLLAPARAARPLLSRLTEQQGSPPLSRHGFTQACRRAIEAALPEARVLRAHALRLELVHPALPGGSLRAPLHDAWRDYLRAPREPDQAGSAALEAVRILLASPAAPLEELPLEELLRGLLPTLALLAPEGERALRQLAGPLQAALLHDDGRHIREVSSAALAHHALAFDEALRRAVDNAEALTLAAPEGVQYFDLDQGRVVVFDFDDPAGAGRVLSSQARGLLVDLLGEPCLCVVPTRDALLACSMLEQDAIDWLQAEARTRAAEGPFALAPELLVVTRDSVAPSTKDLAASLVLAES